MALDSMHALEVPSARSCTARKLDFLVAGGHFRQVARKLALRAPEINLKRERILAAGIAFNHPLQRCIGHKAAVPIVLAIDLDRRKARWQRPARHNMLRGDLVSVGIEVDKIAGPDIDRTRAEARHPGVEAIKIHQALKRVLEVAGVVEASRRKRSARLEPRHDSSCREETRGAANGREIGAHVVEEIAGIVTPGQITEGTA